jgi:hypothetical protein
VINHNTINRLRKNTGTGSYVASSIPGDSSYINAPRGVAV